MSWTAGWQRTLPGTNIHRVALLTELRVYNSQRQVSTRVDRDRAVRLLQQGVFNPAQIAGMLNCTAQTIRNIARETGHTAKPLAPMGLFDKYGIDWIFLVCQSLAQGIKPSEYLISGLPYCGDIGIVSYISGVPQHVIVRARKRLEETDVDQYRERMAANAGLSESV